MSKAPIESFVIDRATWRCNGHGTGPSELLNTEGYMCCLGFYGRACGIRPSRLLGREVPSEMPRTKAYVPLVKRDEHGYNVNTLGNHLIKANDHFQIDTERECRVGELFAELGVKVEFTGEYEVQG